MKSIILIITLLFIFFLFPRYETVDASQLLTDEDSFCGSMEDLISLLDDYKEIVIFNGMSSDTDDPKMHLLTVNVITGTWTEFSLNNEGLVCIVKEGKNAALNPILSKNTSVI